MFLCKLTNFQKWFHMSGSIPFTAAKMDDGISNIHTSKRSLISMFENKDEAKLTGTNTKAIGTHVSVTWHYWLHLSFITQGLIIVWPISCLHLTMQTCWNLLFHLNHRNISVCMQFILLTGQFFTSFMLIKPTVVLHVSCWGTVSKLGLNAQTPMHDTTADNSLSKSTV